MTLHVRALLRLSDILPRSSASSLLCFLKTLINLINFNNVPFCKSHVTWFCWFACENCLLWRSESTLLERGRAIIILSRLCIMIMYFHNRWRPKSKLNFNCTALKFTQLNQNCITHSSDETTDFSLVTYAKFLQSSAFIQATTDRTDRTSIIGFFWMYIRILNKISVKLL